MHEAKMKTSAALGETLPSSRISFYVIIWSLYFQKKIRKEKYLYHVLEVNVISWKKQRVTRNKLNNIHSKNEYKTNQMKKIKGKICYPGKF